MKKNDYILQELKELNSNLGNVTFQNVYSVPTGYFDELAVKVLTRIKAIEAKDAAEELSFLSASLSNASKLHPYTVPAGYFETLSENIMQLVRESNDYQSAKEEIETLSPLLSGLNKKMPYTVPGGYFDSLGKNMDKPAAKVISISSRKWFKYAAAAVVTGIIFLAGFIYLKPFNRIDPVEEPYAWVKKNINKVDKTDIDSFVKLADHDLASQSVVATNPVKPGEIKELMKDISDREIQEFLDATPDIDEDVELMMN